MWHWYTAEDRRQAAAIVLILVVAGLFLAAMAPVLAGSVMIMLSRESSPNRLVGNGPGIAADLWRTPSQPALAFGVGHMAPALFWLLTGLILLAIIFGFVWFAQTAYRMIAPTGTGFAGHADIARDLSLSACRKRAKVTRPDLNRKARRTACDLQLGIPLHQAPVTRSQLWLPLARIHRLSW